MSTTQRGRPAIRPGERGGIRARKRGSGWHCRVRYRDLDGNEHEFNKTGKTKTSCEDAAHEHWVDLKRALEATAPASEFSLGVIAERWLTQLERDIAGDDRSINTAIGYRKSWEGTLRPMCGDWDVNETTRADLQNLLYEGLFRRNHRGEYMHDTEGHLIPVVGPQPRQVLRQLMAFAADRGYRRDGLNPLAGTRCPASPPRSERLKRTLTEDEWVELLAMARTAANRPRASTHLYLVLAIIYYTGVRISEAIGVTNDRIIRDAEADWILFDRKLPESYRVSNLSPLEPTKSKDTRAVIIVPQLGAILAEAMANSRFDAPTDPLVVTRRGTFATHANVRTALRRLVKDTPFEGIHPHSLRRTYLTAAHGEFGKEAAADMGGHKDDGQVLMRHYVDFNEVKVFDPRPMFAAAGSVQSSTKLRMVR